MQGLELFVGGGDLVVRVALFDAALGVRSIDREQARAVVVEEGERTSWVKASTCEAKRLKMWLRFSSISEIPDAL